MKFWYPRQDHREEIWITVFIAIPIIINFFNLRRYGNWEFGITVIKIVTIVGIIVLGILLPMDAVASERLLGTAGDERYGNLTAVVCPPNNTTGCLGHPGFGCYLYFSRG